MVITRHGHILCTMGSVFCEMALKIIFFPKNSRDFFLDFQSIHVNDFQEAFFRLPFYQKKLN